MLYQKIVNEWDEVTYVPTTLGNVLLFFLILLLLFAAVFFARRFASRGFRKAAGQTGSDSPDPDNTHRDRKTTDATAQSHKRNALQPSAKRLTFCGMAIALGTVLSTIKLNQLPFGGSVTLLSMLMISLPGYWFGTGAGLATGIAHGILQLILDPYIIHPVQMILDYLLAFGALGLSGLFARSKNGLIKGYLTGVLFRYVFVTLSGLVFFASCAWEGWDVLPYSMVYNGSYILPEAVITVILLLLPPVKKAFAKITQLARE